MSSIFQDDTISIKKKWDKLFISLFFLVFASFIFVILFFILMIFSEGVSHISWNFLFSNPSHHMLEGGIFPAIVGTILVTFVSSLFSIPMGVVSGIYLTEYATKNRLYRLTWLAVRNLAGVPSVVYGLFGVALFLNTFKMHKSILTAGLTLGILAFPIVISSTVESIKSIPNSLREASLALGASKWQTIYKVVLPTALPGILTGGIMALTRAVGETAPILFTGVAYYISFPSYTLDSQFMSLSYHVFALVTQNADMQTVLPIAYGASFVLVFIVVLLSCLTIYIRQKMSR